MPYIIWRSRMSVGIERIDEDHKQMIRCVNDLDQAINQATYDPRLTAQTLLRLCEYTKSHFDREEKLMLAVEYPDYAVHKLQHDTARRALQDICEEFMEEPAKMVAERIYKFAAEWLVQHILMADMKMVPHIVGPSALAKTA
ncbi:bacteriohemerythrin [Azospirillum rugosum]|uniref:Hemerythrin-like metal-binding protein n=1 Tax=Azospirillum rugosum TaxID=416170 RepID=A0ABS4SLV5_9PROT|nr:bacteriohemerythrin [Azospirillum rugosum]MBP2293550.1 hemerythrin-like metal-binding protein [Azospirillum rugosum]MDQ0529229.1 hemerythrin-like metal-binding protein [Azospirillum rugosum]